jgi:hypothetical protein
MDWILDLLTTCIQHSEPHFTHHWHTQTLVSSVYYSLHQLFTGNGFYWVRFFGLLHSGPLVTAACAGLLSTDSLTNWGQGWWSFHNNLLVLTSSRLLHSLTHQPATWHHFTQLNSWQLFLQNLRESAYNILHKQDRKRRFIYYSPTIPRPLHAHLLPRELTY